MLIFIWYRPQKRNYLSILFWFSLYVIPVISIHPKSAKIYTRRKTELNGYDRDCITAKKTCYKANNS